MPCSKQTAQAQMYRGSVIFLYVTIEIKHHSLIDNEVSVNLNGLHLSKIDWIVSTAIYKLNRELSFLQEVTANCQLIAIWQSNFDTWLWISFGAERCFNFFYLFFLMASIFSKPQRKTRKKLTVKYNKKLNILMFMKLPIIIAL